MRTPGASSQGATAGWAQQFVEQPCRCAALPPNSCRMPDDFNANLTFRDAMRLAVRDQLNAFRLASTKTGTRGQQARVPGALHAVAHAGAGAMPSAAAHAGVAALLRTAATAPLLPCHAAGAVGAVRALHAAPRCRATRLLQRPASSHPAHSPPFVLQVHACDCCGRRVRDPRHLRIEHVNPSFGQVRAALSFFRAGQ